jgi:hypothetical protein
MQSMNFAGVDGVRSGLEVKSAHWTNDKAGAFGVHVQKQDNRRKRRRNCHFLHKQKTGEENKGEFQLKFDKAAWNFYKLRRDAAFAGSGSCDIICIPSGRMPEGCSFGSRLDDL